MVLAILDTVVVTKFFIVVNMAVIIVCIEIMLVDIIFFIPVHALDASVCISPHKADQFPVKKSQKIRTISCIKVIAAEKIAFTCSISAVVTDKFGALSP